MRIETQRLRNLTTGKLHTDIMHVYEDIEAITGLKGLMTHHIPNAMRALEPWLKSAVTDARFWDGEHDPQHDGVIEIPDLSDEERKATVTRFGVLPSPIFQPTAYRKMVAEEKRNNG